MSIIETKNSSFFISFISNGFPFFSIYVLFSSVIKLMMVLQICTNIADEFMERNMFEEEWLAVVRVNRVTIDNVQRYKNCHCFTNFSQTNIAMNRFTT